MKYLKNPAIALLYLLMLILKLDGKGDISWFMIFSPILIDLSAEVIVKVVGSIYDFVTNITESINRNHERYAGQKLYWDAKTNTLYGPYDMEENKND